MLNFETLRLGELPQVLKILLHFIVYVHSANLHFSFSEGLNFANASPQFVRSLDLRRRHLGFELLHERVETLLLEIDLRWGVRIRIFSHAKLVHYII